MTAPHDSVDRIVQAWALSDSRVDASPLEVVGRLLLCAQHCEREILAALAAFRLSFGDFDVINTLRRRADPGAADRRFLDPLEPDEREALAGTLRRLLLPYDG